MKKLLVLVIIIFSTINLSFAEELKKISLSKNAIYVLLVDDEVKEFKISNPNVLRFQLVNTLEDDKKQVIVQPLSYGKTDFNVITSSKSYNYDINIVDNSAFVSDELFEIEDPNKEISK